MSDGVDAAPSVCGNCGQRAAPGAMRCIWCGVPLTAAAAPLVVAPEVPAPAVASVIPPPAPASAPAAPVGIAAGRRAADPGSAAASAPAGPRLVAITVDLVLLVVAAIAAALLFRSPPLVGAVIAELLLLLWILDARTGATPGKALVRLRTARAGTAMSPGAGRSLARGAVHGAGLLVAAGPWIVAASASFDPWRRGWADRITDTATVVVPARVAVPGPAELAPPAAPVPGAGAPAGAARVLPPLPPVPPAIAEPRVVSVAPARPVVEEESAEVPSAPVAPSPVAPSLAADEPGLSLLLVFDTGQRASLAAPLALNLGRNPGPTADGDQLLAVADPESTVSKTHARLEHSRGATWITDGGSTNGTEILGDDGRVTRLDAGVRTLLGEGDRVRLGNRVFTVSVVVEGGAG